LKALNKVATADLSGAAAYNNTTAPEEMKEEDLTPKVNDAAGNEGAPLRKARKIAFFEFENLTSQKLPGQDQNYGKAWNSTEKDDDSDGEFIRIESDVLRDDSSEDEDEGSELEMSLEHPLDTDEQIDAMSFEDFLEVVEVHPRLSFP
jgi:hypothetical protein